MARETRATWAARVARWTSSGLTAAAFAARERINPRTLTYWRWRLRADGAATLPSPRRAAPFVEVVVPEIARDTPTGLEIVLPAGYRVRRGQAVVADTLRTVLDVLEARG
jgi:transposase